MAEFFATTGDGVARITGRGAGMRQAAPTARESVFLGSRRNSVYDSSAIGLRCVAGRAALRYRGCAEAALGSAVRR